MQGGAVAAPTFACVWQSRYRSDLNINSMELLLNFLWLLLALGSLAICGRAQIRPRTEGGVARPRLFVLVASLLVLLFPTVSVTDDLCDLRAVMEEPTACK